MKLASLVFFSVLLLVSNVEPAEELLSPEDNESTITNSWAIELDTDDEAVARDVAAKHGFHFGGRVGSLPRHFHLYRDEDNGKSDSKRGDIIYPDLREHPNVKWHEQQRTISLEKRSVSRNIPHKEHKRVAANYFNDPELPDQWYIASFGKNGIPVGNDMKIMEAWSKGYTGKGITVTVMDDGLDHSHPDLKKNYDPKASLNLNKKNEFSTSEHDPMPRNKRSQYHGTKCAGEIGAAADNEICGVGIAPDVNLGGIRMLDGKVTGITEGSAFTYNLQHNDIFSASWGPKDNGKILAGPSTLGKRALEHGIKTGRGGKGSLYVWASGNGGASGDDCNCDGYTSSIYTIAVGSVSAAGKATYYDEKCASTMAVVYSGDSDGGSRRGLGGYHKIVTTGIGHSCLEHFSGTSAAAPLAAGVLALTLQANKDLTWRDMQNIITRTADMTNAHDSTWKRNAAGYKVSSKFGFGLVNAAKMIEAAKRWKTVAEQKRCVVEVPRASLKKRIINSNEKLVFRVRTNACKGTKNFIKRLEHVQAVIKLTHNKRGVLSIDLVSPGKTSSRLLATRPLDKSKAGIKKWPFMSVHMWGENPAGEWVLTIRDNTMLEDKRHSLRYLLDAREEDETTLENDSREDPEEVRDQLGTAGENFADYENEADEGSRLFRPVVQLEDEEENGKEDFPRGEMEDEDNVNDTHSKGHGVLDKWYLVLYGVAE